MASDKENLVEFFSYLKDIVHADEHGVFQNLQRFAVFPSKSYASWTTKGHPLAPEDNHKSGGRTTTWFLKVNNGSYYGPVQVYSLEFSLESYIYGKQQFYIPFTENKRPTLETIAANKVEIIAAVMQLLNTNLQALAGTVVQIQRAIR